MFNRRTHGLLTQHYNTLQPSETVGGSPDNQMASRRGFRNMGFRWVFRKPFSESKVCSEFSETAQMGHLRVPVFFGNAPLRGALACCALACRWWYAMIRWISAHWLLNSSLIDKFNDRSKDFRKRRGSPQPKGGAPAPSTACENPSTDR